MADDVARAVGAGSSEGVTINGRQYHPRPLSVRELTEVERDCLKRYVRSYLSTHSENLDLLPPDEQAGYMSRKLEETAKWDIDDLPPKFVYDAKRVQPTKKLHQWLKATIDFRDNSSSGKPLPKSKLEQKIRIITASCLDQELLSEEEFEKLTGEKPKKNRVGYVSWWITGSTDGMVTLIWMCFRDSGLTRDQIAAELTDMDQLISISREIERITAPAVGNG